MDFFFRTGVALLLPFMILTNELSAQATISTEVSLKTQGQLTPVDLNILSDSIAVIHFFRSGSNSSFEEVVNFYATKDLRLLNSKVIQRRQFQGFYSVRCMVVNGNAYLLSNIFDDSVRSNLTNVARYNLSTNILDTSITTIVRNTKDVVNGFTVLNNESFLLNSFSGRSYNGDTINFSVYDTLGLLISDSSYVNVPFSVSPLNSDLLPFPKVAPNGNIVYCNQYLNVAVELNPITLSILKEMSFYDRTLTNSKISSPYVSDFEITPKGVEIGGTCIYLTDPNLITLDFQYYYTVRNWGDSLPQERAFGPLKSDNRGYAFHYDVQNDTRYIGGSVPFSNSSLTGNETREVLIYRINDFGADSIILFGDKNHVPFHIATSDKDVFVLSTYTDRGATDSSYYVLTKIPEYAISLAEKQKTPRIYIFPNPCTSHFQIPTTNVEIQQVEIYNQAGQLLRKDILRGTRKISVEELPSGMYIVKMSDKNGESFASVLQKI